MAAVLGTVGLSGFCLAPGTWLGRFLRELPPNVLEGEAPDAVDPMDGPTVDYSYAQEDPGDESQIRPGPWNSIWKGTLPRNRRSATWPKRTSLQETVSSQP